MFVRTLLVDPILFLRIVVLIIISITIHELAHGWAAISQGDKTPKKMGHLTFNPIVHMGIESMIFLILTGISWGIMPFNPNNLRNPKWGKILVAAAGPFANLLLFFLFIILLHFTLKSDNNLILSNRFLYLGAIINFRLFLFNLLPIPPLDGFNVLSELLPQIKILNNSNFGIIILMTLWATGLSLWLSNLGKLAIQTIIF
jgi:Zn-dependent protease